MTRPDEWHAVVKAVAAAISERRFDDLQRLLVHLPPVTQGQLAQQALANSQERSA